MCWCIDYDYEGQPRRAEFGYEIAELPVRLRGGIIKLYQWGARAPRWMSSTPSHPRRAFPETGWARLGDIRAGVWEPYRPMSVRIAATRFRKIDAEQKPHWFGLKPGEYIQGLLAEVGTQNRVYVVTVESPDRSQTWSEWPRIVSAARRSTLHRPGATET